MLVFGAIVLALGATLLPAAPSDTVPIVASGADSLPVAGVDLRFPLMPVPTDTPTPRPRAIEISDAYATRLTVHRYMSYSVIPLFAAQYLAGRQLYDKGSDAPAWAKTTHRVGATALAGVFAVNTVTGAWNWWDSRAVPEKRALRTAHALMMLAAEGGFTYAGVKLSEEAETDGSKRRQHRTVALSSIGLTLASGLMMKIWND
jgi:hypothetical protein